MWGNEISYVGYGWTEDITNGIIYMFVYNVYVGLPCKVYVE